MLLEMFDKIRPVRYCFFTRWTMEMSSGVGSNLTVFLLTRVDGISIVRNSSGSMALQEVSLTVEWRVKSPTAKFAVPMFSSQTAICN